MTPTDAPLPGLATHDELAAGLRVTVAVGDCPSIDRLMDSLGVVVESASAEG